MAEPVPAAFTKGLSTREADAIRVCGGASRQKLDAHWKPRRANPLLVLLGRFVDAEPVDDPAEPSDFYEYLVAHELYLDDGPKFHICRAHALARARVARGRLSADFVCPIDRSDCPMRKVLDLKAGSDLCVSLGLREGGGNERLRHPLRASGRSARDRRSIRARSARSGRARDRVRTPSPSSSS